MVPPFLMLALHVTDTPRGIKFKHERIASPPRTAAGQSSR